MVIRLRPCMRSSTYLLSSTPTLGARSNNVCLVGEKPDVLRPGIVGMRGSMVTRFTAMHDIEYPPRPPGWYSMKLSSICKSAPQAFLSRMQPTLYAARRTPHGALLLVHARSAWSVGIRRAQSRHCRDARVYGHTTTAMRDIEYPPLVVQ